MDRLNRLGVICDSIAAWSLYILIFALPFSKSLVEITIISAFLSLIVKKLAKREQFLNKSSIIDIFLYIFLATSLFSFLNSSYIGLSVRAFFSKSLTFAILFLVAREIINTKEKLHNFIVMAVLSCVIILIDGFVQYFITHVDFLHNYPSFLFHPPTPSVLGNPTASFPFPNDFAAWILVFIFPTGLTAFSRTDRWPKRIISATLFAGLVYSLFLTKVRGAWMAFLLAFGFLSIFKLQKIVVLLLALILLIILFIDKPLASYIVTLTSIKDRMTMWRNSWEIFKAHPIIGSGLNTFYLHYARVRDDEYKNIKGSYAHNCYLQMAAEIGLVGLMSFLLFVTTLIYRGFSSLKAVKKPFYHSLILGINMGLVAFLIHSFVDTNLYSLPLAALFWLAAGFLLTAIEISRSDAQ